MRFDRLTHIYRYRGIRVEKSCTALVKESFEEFDARQTVVRFYWSWKRRRDERYWDIISQTEPMDEVDRLSDDEAMQRIIARWETLRSEAARLGTLFHTFCEMRLNLPVGEVLDMTQFSEVAKEVEQIYRGRSVRQLDHHERDLYHNPRRRR